LPALPAWSRWLAVIWAIGTVSVLGWFFGGRVAAWFFRRRCAKCDDETILAQIVTLKSELGIRRSVAVLVSSRVAAPVVLGGWPPAVVLPPRFRREFDPQQQETILAHELAHLVWRDPAWQGAALVLCSLLWWHPLVWWSRRQLRAANEALADEASLVVPDGPRVLAEALVLLGQRLVRLQPRFGLSLGGSRFRSGLGRRVERLLALPSRGWRTPRRARLAFAHFSLPVLMALVAIVGTAWVPSSVPLMLGETTMSVFSNAWRGSLVATALCSMLGSVPVTADDQPVKTPSASADREKVEKEFKAMREKVAQLEKDGKHDEAEKLKHQAYEMMSKARASYAGSTSSQPAVSGPEAEKIRGQLKELSQKAAQLEKDGKHDEVEKIRHEARELYSKLNPRGATIAVSVGPEREQLYQQMRALHEKIEKAKQEGKSDDVQRLMKEAEGLRTKIYPQGSYGPGRSSSGDREARLQHLRSAAENLKAAGFDAEAQHVMQMIERIRAEGSREGRSSGETSRPLTELRPSSSSVPPGASIMSSRDYAAGPAVQELRGQIEQMRREMRELREQINQAKGGERK
jgi:beta-lactamase regulating signal transducer with metallopeptidase domain